MIVLGPADDVNGLVDTWTEAPEAQSEFNVASVAPRFSRLATELPQTDVSPDIERQTKFTHAVMVDTAPARTVVSPPPPPEPLRVEPSTATSPVTNTGDIRPRPRPDRRTSVPATARSSAGSGAASSTGTAGKAAAARASKADNHALQAAWSAEVQARIARNQTYPRGNHGEGRVKVQMVILRSGTLKEVSLVASSGRPALDQAAIRAVKRAAPFPPAPAALSDAWFKMAQWMNFRRR